MYLKNKIFWSRAFNIFSLNFGKEEILNKFGFDKIIFVCDIENIRNIYAHKYGENVDFKGYIDKFYSHEPYVFENELLVKQKIENILELSNGIIFNDLKDSDYQLFHSLKAILMILLNKKYINLRTLISKKEILLLERSFSNNGLYQENSLDFKIVVLFNILKNYLGTFNFLDKVLENLSKDNKITSLTSIHNGFNHSNYQRTIFYVYSLCLPFLFEYDNGQQILVESNNNRFVIKFNEFNVFIHYENAFGVNNDYLRVIKVTELVNIDSKEVSLEPFKVLNYTFKKCVKRGAIVL